MGRTLILLALCGMAASHVFLYDPPQRSSLWRHEGMNKTGRVIRNNDDMGLNCGGMWIQHERNRGRCGVCGDPYDSDSPPDYPHQYPGVYARGVIAGCYLTGARTMDAEVWITAHHKGHFEFRLCENNDYTRPVTQACLDRHRLLIVTPQGQVVDKYYPDETVDDGIYRVKLVLPRNLICTQCVLQFKYVAGNSWGCDTTSDCGIGKGNQEEFWNCADIAVLPECGGVLGSVAEILEPESPDEQSNLDHTNDQASTIDTHDNMVPMLDQQGRLLINVLNHHANTGSPASIHRLIQNLGIPQQDGGSDHIVSSGVGQRHHQHREQSHAIDDRVNRVLNNEHVIQDALWRAQGTDHAVHLQNDVEENENNVIHSASTQQNRNLEGQMSRDGHGQRGMTGSRTLQPGPGVIRQRPLPHFNNRRRVDVPLNLEPAGVVVVTCRGTGPWEGDNAMREWCSMNCERGFCPETTCICD